MDSDLDKLNKMYDNSELVLLIGFILALLVPFLFSLIH